MAILATRAHGASAERVVNSNKYASLLGAYTSKLRSDSGRPPVIVTTSGRPLGDSRATFRLTPLGLDQGFRIIA
eukprot:scaffold492435_cov19-Prasinocladus_malaysianus.AAC.1